MIIRIQVLTVLTPDQEHGHVVARGYLPSGQELVTSRVAPASEGRTLIRSIVEWLFCNRPNWSVEIDDSPGSTAVVS